MKAKSSTSYSLSKPNCWHHIPWAGVDSMYLLGFSTTPKQIVSKTNFKSTAAANASQTAPTTHLSQISLTVKKEINSLDIKQTMVNLLSPSLIDNCVFETFFNYFLEFKKKLYKYKI